VAKRAGSCCCAQHVEVSVNASWYRPFGHAQIDNAFQSAQCGGIVAVISGSFGTIRNRLS
jgi:hypothetical protein